MYIIISVLVIVLVLCFVAILWVYNRLILIHVNKDNALTDMTDHLDAAIAALPSWIPKKIHTAREKAQTSGEKIAVLNMLANYEDKVIENDAFMKHRSASARPRQFYNTHTKQLNALLKTFPSNIVGSILGYVQEPLIYMTEKEKAGTSSDVTR